MNTKPKTFLDIQAMCREESYQYGGYEKINQFLQDCAVAGSFYVDRTFSETWELSGYPQLSREEMSGSSVNYFPAMYFNIDVGTYENRQFLKLRSDQEQCELMLEFNENKLQLLFEHLKRIFLNGQSVIEVCEQYQHKLRSGKGGDINAENFADYHELVDPLIEEYLNQEKISGKKPNTWITSRIAPEIVALIESGREGLGKKDGTKKELEARVKKRLEKRIKNIREKQ